MYTILFPNQNGAYINSLGSIYRIYISFLSQIGLQYVQFMNTIILQRLIVESFNMSYYGYPACLVSLLLAFCGCCALCSSSHKLERVEPRAYHKVHLTELGLGYSINRPTSTWWWSHSLPFAFQLTLYDGFILHQHTDTPRFSPGITEITDSCVLMICDCVFHLSNKNAHIECGQCVVSVLCNTFETVVDRLLAVSKSVIGILGKLL